MEIKWREHGDTIRIFQTNHQKSVEKYVFFWGRVNQPISREHLALSHLVFISLGWINPESSSVQHLVSYLAADIIRLMGIAHAWIMIFLADLGQYDPELTINHLPSGNLT